MPILGGLLAGLFGGIFQFLVSFVTRKTALAGAWIVTFGALVTGMVAAVAAAIGTINIVVPSSSGASLGFYIAAADFGLSVGAVCIAVDAVVYVYRWNVGNLSLLARA